MKPPRPTPPERLSPALDSSGTLPTGQSLLPEGLPQELKRMLASAPDLTARFELGQVLGEGGMGVVMAARDRDNDGALVAIKLLTRTGPAAVYALKNEFRSLQGITHRNLVGLHELGVDGVLWFIVEELIRGEHFLQHVRGIDSADCDHARLREALPQLVRAVTSLHDQGTVHRDLKPRNILVEEGGRVVVVDFGLAIDERGDSGGDRFFGTPTYAAPELLRGEKSSAASDWYAVGVLLYEALTGRLPFEGSIVQLMHEKNSRASLPPSQLVAEIPEDLEALCMALLSQDPLARPGPEDIFEALGGSGARSEPVRGAPDTFVGRGTELAALGDAWARSRQASSTVHAWISGASGIGKSALADHFASATGRDHDAIVLRSRCYARERLPFKALDGVVDALGRYLRSLSPDARRPLLPPDAGALARVFPILLHIPEVAAGADTAATESPLQQRAAAFGALRSLLQRLGERSPLLIVMDDLQWGDTDSAQLLRHLFSPPGAPRCLVVGTFRSEERETSATLRTLFASGVLADTLELELGPLSHEDGERLARLMAPMRDPARIAGREAGGNPFLIGELARAAERSSGPPDVASVMNHRLAELQPEARRLLEAVCLASRPIPQSVAGRATSASVVAQATALSARSLLRTRSADGELHLEPYHDRIREAVSESAPEERARRVHVDLALAYEQERPGDAEAIVFHYEHANRHKSAALAAVRAAERAEAVLAFPRTAELLQLAAAHPEVHDDPASVLEALGRAHENSGRTADAAAAYERAASHSDGDAAGRLDRMAMRAYLMGGDVHHGWTLTQRLCAGVGVSTPRSTRLAGSFGMLRYYTQLAFEASPELWLDHDSVAESEESAERERRVDVLWAAFRGFHTLSLEYSAWLYFRWYTQARRLGRDLDRGRALLMEGSAEVALDGSFSKASQERIDTGLALAECIDDPREQAFALAQRAASNLFAGRLRPARADFDRVEGLLHAHGLSVGPVCSYAHVGRLLTWFFLGEVGYAKEHGDAWLAEADERGDVYQRLVIQVPGAYRFLVDDRVDEALASWNEGMRTETQLRHPYDGDPWWGVLLHHYAGNPEHAHELAYRAQSIEAKAALRYRALNRVWLAFTRGNASAGMLAQEPTHRRYAKEVARSARALRREPMNLAAPFAAQLEAALATSATSARSGSNRELYVRRLQEAIAAYDSLSMGLYAAALRWRLAEIPAAPDAAAARLSARRAFAAQEIARPQAWVEGLTPGLALEPA